MERLATLIILVILCTLDIQGQTMTISGYVRNSQTAEPIPFATIQILGTPSGTISNEDGFFVFHYNREKADSLIFSALAFKRLTLLLQGSKNPLDVYLLPETYALSTVEIRPMEEDIIFDHLAMIIQSYRKNSSQSSAKAYLRVNTQSDSLPIEFIEAFYNVHTAVELGPYKLELKMGRFGHDKHKKFYSLNTTNQIMSLNLFRKNGNTAFPKWCGNMNLKKLKRSYEIASIAGNESGYNLKLNPKSEDLFDVEIDVDSISKRIKSLRLHVANKDLNGYTPIVEKDSLKYHSVDVLVQYYPDTDKINLIKMDQIIDYYHSGGQVQRYETSVDLLMIDYTRLFYDPAEFSSVRMTNDYAQMIAFGFNSEFWESNNTIFSSEILNSQLDKLILSGDVANLKSNYVSEDLRFLLNYPLKELNKSTRIMWDDFGLNSSSTAIENVDQKRMSREYSMTDLYNLNFDYILNPFRVDDTLKYYSRLYFNRDQSYFFLEKNESLLLSIDSIKSQILVLKDSLDFFNQTVTEDMLRQRILEFRKEIGKLSTQVLLFKPDRNASLSQMRKDSASVYYNIAVAFQHTGKLEKALEFYEKSLKSANKDDHLLLKDLYFNRGLLWMDLNQVNRACDDFSKGMTLGDLESEKRYDANCKVKNIIER